MRTRTVHISEPYDVYIGRAGHGRDGYFGNPIKLLGDTKTLRALCIEQYRNYFHERLERDLEFKRRVLELKGKRLGCFCKPNKQCHGDVIVEYLENFPEVVRGGQLPP